MFLLYAQWRFRGVSPQKAWLRVEEAAWPSRAAALESAFALYAARMERTTLDIVAGLAGDS